MKKTATKPKIFKDIKDKNSIITKDRKNDVKFENRRNSQSKTPQKRHTINKVSNLSSFKSKTPIIQRIANPLQNKSVHKKIEFSINNSIDFSIVNNNNKKDLTLIKEEQFNLCKEEENKEINMLLKDIDRFIYDIEETNDNIKEKGLIINEAKHFFIKNNIFLNFINNSIKSKDDYYFNKNESSLIQFKNVWLLIREINNFKEDINVLVSEEVNFYINNASISKNKEKKESLSSNSTSKLKIKKQFNKIENGIYRFPIKISCMNNTKDNETCNYDLVKNENIRLSDILNPSYFEHASLNKSNVNDYTELAKNNDNDNDKMLDKLIDSICRDNNQSPKLQLEKTQEEDSKKKSDEEVLDEVLDLSCNSNFSLYESNIRKLSSSSSVKSLKNSYKQNNKNKDIAYPTNLLSNSIVKNKKNIIDYASDSSRQNSGIKSNKISKYSSIKRLDYSIDDIKSQGFNDNEINK